jgi:hypothetical protein
MAGSGIHLNPANRGKFTAKANRSGKSVAAYANKVTKPGSKASTKTKRQAVFAKNARKWNKGGKRK